jgi:hypothetical protein
LPQYRVRPGKVSFAFRMRPIDLGSENAAELARTVLAPPR